MNYFFSGVNELFNSIEIEIVIVSNKKTVPSMDLGSCLHLPFWGSTTVFNYSRTPLFRSPKGNGKKFEIAGLRNNRESVKGKGKSKGIRSSFEKAGTSN